MRFIILFIICFGFPVTGLATEIDTARIVRVADSIVLANTSQDFFDYLSKPEKRLSIFRTIPPDTDYDRSRVNDNEYIRQFERITYLVGYGMKLKNGEFFHLKSDTATDILSWGYPEIGVKIDTNYKVIETPDFEILEKAYNRIVDAQIIERDSAIICAMPHFKIKKKRISRAVVEYDAIADLLYWRVSKTKGQSKVHEEQVLIDAEKAVFIKKEDKYYVVVVGY